MDLFAAGAGWDTSQRIIIFPYQDIDTLNVRLLKELVQKIIINPDNQLKIVWNFNDTVSALLKQESPESVEVAG